MIRFDAKFFLHGFVSSMGGIPVTLAITLISLILATPLSFFMALARINKTPVFSQISSFYISFVQGTPSAVQILMLYSVMPSLLSSLFKSLGIAFNVFAINPIYYACAIFALNTAAVLSEVFRTALMTVETGQMEAALSVGLTVPQAYRRVVLPQALAAAMPNICNTTVSVIKGTSLVFLMAVKDITAIAKIEAAYGYNYIEAYLDIWIIYILLCSATEFLFKHAENGLKAFRGGEKAAKKPRGGARLAENQQRP